MRLSNYDQWKLDCGPDEGEAYQSDACRICGAGDTFPEGLDAGLCEPCAMAGDGPNPDDQRDEARDREFDRAEDDWNE